MTTNFNNNSKGSTQRYTNKRSVDASWRFSIQKAKSSPMFLRKYTAGFTLLETMFAIAIILTAVVGPIVLLGGSLNKIYFARDQVIAINLAQEAIETVRQVRDTNMLNAVAWDTNLLAGDSIVDVGNLVSSCNPTCTAPATLVVYDAPLGVYRQDQPADEVNILSTPFSRKITISGSGNERKVVATVTWNTGALPGSIVVSASLFKWTP